MSSSSLLPVCSRVLRTRYAIFTELSAKGSTHSFTVPRLDFGTLVVLTHRTQTRHRMRLQGWLACIPWADLHLFVTAGDRIPPAAGVSRVPWGPL